MKNTILYITLMVFSFSFYSCSEDLEIWDSNTLSYSGTYDIQLLSEDESTVYIDYSAGDQIQLYNTAANVANDIWIYDLDGVFPLTSKFNFTGDSTSFMSSSSNWDDLTNNLDAIELPATAPTAAGETVTEDRDYIRAAITEGSIGTADVETTGGNTSDSVRMKIVLYSGTATFTGYETDEESWVVPGVPEFAWEFTSVAYDNTLDETYVISGYRYTGHEEDEH